MANKYSGGETFPSAAGAQPLTSREQLLAFLHLDVSSCLDSRQIFASRTDILEYLGCGESGFKIPSRVSGGRGCMMDVPWRPSKELQSPL